jgi:hypothetical protein
MKTSERFVAPFAALQPWPSFSLWKLARKRCASIFHFVH